MSGRGVHLDGAEVSRRRLHVGCVIVFVCGGSGDSILHEN